MGFDIKRIKSYHEWSEKKLIVIHMETKFLDVESCLLLAKIPFTTISYETDSFVNKLKSQSHNSVGIIITGSRKKGNELPELPIEIENLNIPVLGLCYGNEWLGQTLGCTIGYCNPPMGEISEVSATLGESILFDGIDNKENVIVTMAHEYMITELGPGCTKIASTKLTPIAGFQNIERKIFGLQFHPEKGFLGDTIFKNFFKFCNY
jgi:GMP synthase-like glutamine amidotransferase